MSPAGRPGIATAAVAVLALCAQFGTLTHGALAGHVRCEHGEFIEVGEGELLPPLPAAREAGLGAASTDVPLSGHRHCLKQTDVDADLALRPPAPELLAPSTTRAPAPEQRTAAAGRDRYRLVPKQSPPE